MAQKHEQRPENAIKPETKISINHKKKKVKDKEAYLNKTPCKKSPNKIEHVNTRPRMLHCVASRHLVLGRDKQSVLRIERTPRQEIHVFLEDPSSIDSRLVHAVLVHESHLNPPLQRSS